MERLPSSTRLTCITPVHTAGCVDVTVTTPGGSATVTDAYTYVNPVTVVIGAPSKTLTNAGPVSFLVSYTDAAMVTLSASDVALNGTGSATGSLGVSGDGTAARMVTISGITGDGLLGITLRPGTAKDFAGISDNGTGPSATFTVDNTAPVITSITTSPPTVGTTCGPVYFTVTYSGADWVTLNAADITLIGTGTATATGIRCMGSQTYVRSVALSGISGDGTLGFQIAAGTARDSIGNKAAGATSPTLIVDNIVPAVQSIVLQTPTPTRAATAIWRVTFSEPLAANATAFTLTRVSGNVNGYAASSVNPTFGNVVDVTVKTGVGAGVLRLDVTSNVIKDIAGNVVPPFTTGDSCTIDRIAPQNAPTIEAPIGSGMATIPTFQWTPVDRATDYSLTLQDITTTVTKIYDTTMPHSDPWWQAGTSNRWPSNLVLADKHLYMAQITPSNEFGGGPISAAIVFGVGTAPTQAPRTAPTISQPSGYNNSTSNVDVLWTSVSDASSYNLWVIDTTTNLTTANVPVTSTAYRLPSLQSTHTYVAYVKGVNYFGAGPWSAADNFGCDGAPSGPPTAIPTLTSPTANTLYEATPSTVRFQWENVANASTYSLLVLNVSNNTTAFTGSVAQTVGTFTYKDIALAAGFNYKAYVKAGNSFGWTAYSAAVLFGTTGAATALPLAPTITRPAVNGSVSYQNVQFQWTTQNGDSFFNVLVYNITNNYALQFSATPTTNTATCTLTPLCTYIAYVRANNAYGASAYARVTFSTLAMAPQVLAPAITSSATVTATAGQAFSYTITASGTQPITYTVRGLASGLVFDNVNTISGVPTDAGAVTITLTAANAAGSDTKTLTIIISAAASREAPVKPASPPPGQF